MTSKREEVAMSAASAMADFDSASGGEATMFQLAKVSFAVFEQALGEATSTPTDDERAEVERVQKAAWAEIHGQDPTRKYSVAEVKRIVYSFDNVLSGLLARRPVQGSGNSAQNSDDEREILTRIIHDETGEPEEESGFVADAILAAGFRRPVQGETTDGEGAARKVAEERYPTLRPHPGEAMYPKSALHHYKQGAFIAGWKARRPVQGEPTDDERESTSPDHPCFYGCLDETHTVPQGEPTDAQVEAALQEWWYGEHEDTWEAKMRAALRAAFQTGEKHA